MKMVSSFKVFQTWRIFDAFLSIQHNSETVRDRTNRISMVFCDPHGLISPAFVWQRDYIKFILCVCGVEWRGGGGKYTRWMALKHPYSDPFIYWTTRCLSFRSFIFLCMFFKVLNLKSWRALNKTNQSKAIWDIWNLHVLNYSLKKQMLIFYC